MGDTNDIAMDAPLIEAPVSEDVEETPSPATSDDGTPSKAADQATSKDAPTAKPVWGLDDFLARYNSDPEFKKAVDKQHIEPRANALFQKQRDRDLKVARKAELTEAVQEPVRALELAQTELNALVAEDSHTTQISAAVQHELERLAGDEDDGPYYAELYKREGGDKLTDRLREDPQAGFNWIRREVRKLAIAAEAKKVTPKLAEAMAEHQSNQKLAALPVPPTGTTAAARSDEDFLAAYADGKSDDLARAIRLFGYK